MLICNVQCEICNEILAFFHHGPFAIIPRMSLHQVLFYFITGIMFMAALFVILAKNPIYSVLSLLVSMSCLALHFLLLGSPFLAILQMLIYAGAVLVLFIFVVMLLNLQEEKRPARERMVFLPAGAILAFSCFVMLTVLILSSPQRSLVQASDPSRGRPVLHSAGPTPTSVADLARSIFTTHFFPFEMTSFIMLVAVIGAVTLVRRPKTSEKGQGVRGK